MTLLIVCWALSLTLLIAVVAYAYIRKNALLSFSDTEEKTLGGFFATELRGLGDDLVAGAVRVRPHGERVAIESWTLVKKGHNMLIEKALGRITTEKGNAASFFLKRIAEQKEAYRRKGREEI